MKTLYIPPGTEARDVLCITNKPPLGGCKVLDTERPAGIVCWGMSCQECIFDGTALDDVVDDFEVVFWSDK